MYHHQLTYRSRYHRYKKVLSVGVSKTKCSDLGICYNQALINFDSQSIKIFLIEFPSSSFLVKPVPVPPEFGTFIRQKNSLVISWIDSINKNRDCESIYQYRSIFHHYTTRSSDKAAIEIIPLVYKEKTWPVKFEKSGISVNAVNSYGEIFLFLQMQFFINPKTKINPLNYVMMNNILYNAEALIPVTY